MPGGRHRHKSQTQESKDKGKKRRPSKESSTSSGTLCSSGSCELSPTTPVETIDYMGIIKQLTDAEPDKMPVADVSNIKDECGNYDVNVFLKSGYDDLKNIISWSKYVPGFNDLQHDDKVCILRSCWMDLVVLRLSYRSLSYPRGITVFGKELCLPHSEVLKMGWTQNMIDGHEEFTEKIRVVGPDKSEFACLCALVLLTSDCPELENKAGVAYLQSAISSCLQHYVKNYYPFQQSRLGKVLLCLPTLRSYSAKAFENYTVFEMLGKIEIPPLVKELLQ